MRPREAMFGSGLRRGEIMHQPFADVFAAHCGGRPVAGSIDFYDALLPRRQQDPFQASQVMRSALWREEARMFAGAAGLCRQRPFSGLAEVTSRDRTDVAIRSSTGSQSIPGSLPHSITIACASAASVLTRNAGTATDLK